MADGIMKWFIHGERGISSETMASTALGSTRERPCHPLDPADLNRCIKLVDDAPEVKEVFPKIAALSPQWKAVIDHWDELRELFIGEVGYDWAERHKSAPLTYKRMQDLFREAKA